MQRALNPESLVYMIFLVAYDQYNFAVQFHPTPSLELMINLLLNIQARLHLPQ